MLLEQAIIKLSFHRIYYYRGDDNDFQQLLKSCFKGRRPIFYPSEYPGVIFKQVLERVNHDQRLLNSLYHLATMKSLYDEFYLYIVAIFTNLGHYRCSYPIRRNKIRRHDIDFAICTLEKQKHYSYLSYFEKERIFEQYRCCCPHLIHQRLLPGINFENRHQHLRAPWLGLKLEVFDYLLRYKIIPIDGKKLELLRKDRTTMSRKINICELLKQLAIEDPDFYRYLPEWLEILLIIISEYKPPLRVDYTISGKYDTPLERSLQQGLIKNYPICCEIFRQGGERSWSLNRLFYGLGMSDYFYLCKGDKCFKKHLFPAPSSNILLQIECRDFEEITEAVNITNKNLLYEVVNIIRQQNQVLQSLV